MSKHHHLQAPSLYRQLTRASVRPFTDRRIANCTSRWIVRAELADFDIVDSYSRNWLTNYVTCVRRRPLDCWPVNDAVSCSLIDAIQHPSIRQEGFSCDYCKTLTGKDVWNDRTDSTIGRRIVQRELLLPKLKPLSDCLYSDFQVIKTCRTPYMPQKWTINFWRQLHQILADNHNSFTAEKSNKFE